MRDWTRYVREHLSLPDLTTEWESEAIQELASQLEDSYLEALSQGLSEEEADAHARTQITDWQELSRAIVRSRPSGRKPRYERWTDHSEELARQRGGPWGLVADLANDVRFALRSFGRSPGFLAVALLTLALGIGGVTTIYTLIDQVLLRPVPYPDSDELVLLWEKLAAFENAMVAYPNFLDWRDRNRVFEDLAAWNDGSLSLTGDGDPVELEVARVSASLFPLLRAEPALGRTFLPEEDRIGGDRVVVLTHGLWESRFGSDPGVVGRTLVLGDLAYTVVGVMPGHFWFPPSASNVDIFVPIEQFAEDWIENRGTHPGITVLGRLDSGVSIQQAREDMERVALQLEEEYPDTNVGSRVHAASLHERITRSSRDGLLLLLVAVGFLFLIACTNVANLVLARAVSREREIALRATLGAGGPRIVRLLLAESVTLWLLGGILGIILAREGTRVVATLFADEIPRIFHIGIDLRVVAVALLVSLATGVLFGLMPALRTLRPDMHRFLKEGGRSSGGLGRNRFRSGLVIAEVGLAVALLVGAGLTLRSFGKMVGTSPGIDPERVLTAKINLPRGRYAEESARTGFYYQLLDRVRALPGVQSAATSYVLPMALGGWQSAFHVEGDPPEEEGRYTFAEISAVSRDYFATMGIPLLRGRDFTRQDGADAPGVIVVGQGFAERFWPDQDPIGKRLKFGDYSSESEWLEVVGVVGSVKLNGVVNDVLPQFYLPHGQVNTFGYFLAVKTERDPALLVEPIRRTVLALDPNQPISSVRTMDEYVEASVESGELLALLLGIFAVAALLLAAVGIYGVMAHATAERTHEIGIRIALGARRDEVLGMVLRQGMLHVAAGILLGLGLSVIAGRLMQSELFGVSAYDPATFFLAPLFLLGVAALANLVPARRATAVDPVRALQAE